MYLLYLKTSRRLDPDQFTAGVSGDKKRANAIVLGFDLPPGQADQSPMMNLAYETSVQVGKETTITGIATVAQTVGNAQTQSGLYGNENTAENRTTGGAGLRVNNRTFGSYGIQYGNTGSGNSFGGPQGESITVTGNKSFKLGQGSIALNASQAFIQGPDTQGNRFTGNTVFQMPLGVNGKAGTVTAQATYGSGKQESPTSLKNTKNREGNISYRKGGTAFSGKISHTGETYTNKPEDLEEPEAVIQNAMNTYALTAQTTVFKRGESSSGGKVTASGTLTHQTSGAGPSKTGGNISLRAEF